MEAMVDENLRELNRNERERESHEREKEKEKEKGWNGTEEKWGWWVPYSYGAVIRTISVANDLTAFGD
jgi:hypothetical protein